MDDLDNHLGGGPWSRSRTSPYRAPRLGAREPITRGWVADMLERAMASSITPTPSVPATRSQANVNHDARLRALRLAWEARGIPWDERTACGYLRHHPWEGEARIEER